MSLSVLGCCRWDGMDCSVSLCDDDSGDNVNDDIDHYISHWNYRGFVIRMHDAIKYVHRPIVVMRPIILKLKSCAFSIC